MDKDGIFWTCIWTLLFLFITLNTYISHLNVVSENETKLKIQTMKTKSDLELAKHYKDYAISLEELRKDLHEN